MNDETVQREVGDRAVTHEDRIQQLEHAQKRLEGSLRRIFESLPWNSKSVDEPES